MGQPDRFGNKKILLVEGDATDAELVVSLLDKMGYASATAENGLRALFLLKKDPSFDLVLAEAQLPDITGVDLLSRIRIAEEDIGYMPVILFTSASDRDTVLKAAKWKVNDFIVKPFTHGSFLHRVSMWANKTAERQWKTMSPLQQKVLRVTNSTLHKAWQGAERGDPLEYQAFKDIGETLLAVTADKEETGGMLEALRQHDGYTFVHSLRTATYLTIFARAMGFPDERVAIVAAGGVLHDIGKSRTPLDILNKPGKFDPEEWRIMQQHVEHTVAILRQAGGVPEDALEIAWSHHEKINGAGYPRGLSGDAFSELARMASISDAYVALTDRRVYKPAMPPEEALEILQNDADHFDPKLAELFKQRVFNWLPPQA
jgi:putative nucleotidyltransferase with HDIG domain